MINYLSNGKVKIIHLIVGLIKKYCYIKWVIFQNSMLIVKTNRSSRHGCSVNLPHIFRTPFLKNTSWWLLLNEIKVESDLPNYVIRLKNATGVDVSKFAKKADLASLKSYVDELDFHKLKTLSDDLIKLSNAADNNFVRKII